MCIKLFTLHPTPLSPSPASFGVRMVRQINGMITCGETSAWQPSDQKIPQKAKKKKPKKPQKQANPIM